MVGIPVVISLVGYTAYSALTIKNRENPLLTNIDDRIYSDRWSTESGTRRFLPSLDRQNSVNVDTTGKRLLNWSKEGGKRKTKKKI